MSIKAQTSFSLKDQLFNRDTVTQLGNRIAAVDGAFKVSQFVEGALAKFPQLELKERIACLVSELSEQMPEDILQAQQWLLAALPPPLDPLRSDDDFGEFIWVVPGEYVARFGCDEKSLPHSLDFLREATQRFSSEFALRPFLQRFPDETLQQVFHWTEDPHYHVRRLASEGTRPFLPWAQRVQLPLDTLSDVLTRLHHDPTRYVTRSVANALNDISKIDASFALQVMREWQLLEQQDDRELDWMMRHASRSMVKADHPQALSMLGYPTEPRFSLSNVQANSVVVVGEALEWSATVRSQQAQNLRMALRVHFLKANGQHKAKVFALKDIHLDAGEEIGLSKRIPFKPLTTRVLYPGTHYVEFVANGVTRQKRAFEFTT